MSTATLSRTQEETNTWQSMFPNEQTTETQSAVFVKKLLAIAVSNITYLRGIFPERAFADRCLEDLNLKILRDSGDCPGACQVIKWVKGCFDALDKKYLKMLIVGIYVDPNEPDNVIESYTFKFSYSESPSVEIYRNDEKISDAQTTAETKKATIRLLRTIVILSQSLHSLPDEVLMTMKLLYYDDVTPRDYEPPGFVSAVTDAFEFDEEPMNIKVGDVVTPFHTVKVRVKTDSKQFVTEEEAAEDAAEHQLQQETPSVTTPKSVQRSVSGQEKGGAEQMIAEPVEADSAPKHTPAKPGSKDEAMNNQPPSSQGSQVTSEQDAQVRCACGCNEDDDTVEENTDMESDMPQADEPEVAAQKSQGKKKQENPQPRPVDIEIEDLTSQTNEINLTGRKKKGRAKSDTGKSNSGKLKGKTFELQDSSSQRKGRKRVKALTEENDFDPYESDGETGGKKRKASVAERALLV